MNIFLFSIDLKLFFLIMFSFIFVVPLFLKRKLFVISYLSVYFLILCLGVFLDITLTKESISFSLLLTNTWASNSISIAYFNPLSVLINLFLLFPIGFICPFIIKNCNIAKVIIIGVIVSFTIEFLQFLLPIIRYPEVLDIINNTISVILGYMYYLLVNRAFHRGEKYDKLSQQKNSN